MVLLPNPDKLKDASTSATNADNAKRLIFFEHPDLDQMARHFIGNNQR